MTIKKYKKIKLVLTSLLFIIVSCSLWKEGALLALTGVVGYTLVLSLIKIKVNGVLTDERQIEVTSRASQISFQILMPILALSSIVLIASGGIEDLHYIKSIGIILSYISCLGILIYLFAYFYFDRKTGGR